MEPSRKAQERASSQHLARRHTPPKRRVRFFSWPVRVLLLLLVLVGAFAYFNGESRAAPGDYAIYREATGLESVTTTATNQAWDTTVSAASMFSIDAGRTTVTLSEVGHYLALYNLGIEYVSGTGRIETQGYLNINGTNSTYGRASCLVLNLGGASQCVMSGAAIIATAATTDNIKVVGQRTDTSAATARRMANTSALTLVRLDDDWAYARYREAGGGQTFNTAGVWSTLSIDTSDEQDTGYSRTDGDITIAAPGRYLVSTNVHYVTTRTGRERLMATRLTLGGTEVGGTRVTALATGDNSDQDMVASYIGIVTTTAANQVLRLQGTCLGPDCGNTTNAANGTAITIVQLASTVETVSLSEAGGGQQVDATNDPILWDTNDRVDSAAFSHSTTTSTSRVNVNASDNYLFLGTFYSNRTTPNTTILNPYWQLRTNGTTKLTYGSFDAVNPGTSGTRAANQSGASGGSIFPALTSGDYVEFVNTDTSVGATTDPFFAAGNMALHGIRLSTLNEPDITVATNGTQTATANVPSTNFYLGGKFAFIANHTFPTETISSVTITEMGTVDAQNDLSNIRLYYEYDTSNPYDCASETYAGTELQFGATSTSFSGINGSSTFTTGASVTASTTQTVCMYVVLDVDSTASDGETIDVEITDPTTQVVLGGGPVGPNGTVALSGSTLLQDDTLTQIHYHWRNDDGNEAGATSATGGTEDTVLVNLSPGDPKRIRLEVSNEGSATSASTQFRLEYATKTASCLAATGWIDVGAAGGVFDMFNTGNLTDGNNTTNISLATGGVTDENTTFLTPNGGVRDVTSQTGALTATSGNFIELEYSVVATASAAAGTSYCFRVTDAGTPLPSYLSYPETSIAAGTLVSSVGTQNSTVDASTTNFYLGGSWAIQSLSGTRDVTSVILTEVGSIDAQTALSNIRLYYEYDTTTFDCTSVSYNGTENQYGATTTFNGANGSSTFSQTLSISPTQTLCLYSVFDVGPTATDTDTIDIQITNPGTQVTMSVGAVNPNTPVGPTGVTTVLKPKLEQVHYHWRNDDGSETGATSATGGIEDTNITNVQRTTTQRLRMEVSNEGGTSTQPTVFGLEYAERSGSCAVSTGWSSVGGGGAAWVMSDSPNLTDGNNTTNISLATGGVTDENTTFLTPNGGVRDTSNQTGSLTATSGNFIEMEFAIEATTEASFGTTYCFRVTGTGTPVSSYLTYPQATIRQNQDFYIQRNETTIPNGNTSVSIVAGVDYVTPATTSRAFIRITNTLSTGAGNSTGGGTQNADNVTAYISNPGNIMSGITFTRSGNTGDTKIFWEIVEYVGPTGGDNEMLVRSTQVATFANKSLTANVSVTNVVDDTKAVVFVTGQGNPQNNATDYDTALVTANWNGTANQAEFTRGRFSGGPGNSADVSFAVVEFTGANWLVQRTEHTYSAVGAVENVGITSVNDVSRAFIHSQHRTNQGTVANLGHLVWLSGAGQVSFMLSGGATSPGTHVSVAWIIENTQTNGYPMLVTRSSGSQTAGGTNPSTFSIAIGATLSATNNASIFTTLTASSTDTSHPRALAGANIASTTHYELWISDTGSNRMYQTEIVEWPTAVLTVSQNYYRFYVDNGSLDPTDPWPVGVTDLGENTSITGLDVPPSTGDLVRIRMSLNISGANISAGSKQFALEYGVRGGSCSGVSTWYQLGDIGSTTAAWRGYAGTTTDGTALSTNPPTVGDLNLSVSDRAGTYEGENPTVVNPYKIFIGEDVEYDWLVQANSVTDLATYCFRMVNDGGSELDAYIYYPTITVAGFEVEQQDWRWFDDETSLTPTAGLAATNTAPINIAQGNILKLRLLLEETAGRSGTDVKYKLQWSETSDFGVAHDVADMDTCGTDSRWCYADGAGTEGALISTKLFARADTCTGGTGDGCGTRNEYSYSPDIVGEVGTTTTNSAGTLVTLQHTYDDPIFIVEAISGDDTGGGTNRPAAAIITATSTSSFTVRIQEPDDEPDTHGIETVGYIVMERGAYQLPDGRRVDVNSTTTTNYYGNAAAGSSDGTCYFTQTFSGTPVLYTSLQTNYNTGTPDFLTASQLLITADDFMCSIEVPENVSTPPSVAETIGWIAIEGGSFTNNAIPLLATTTPTSITGWSDTPWYEILFPYQSFLTVPGILGSKQTRNGAEGGWLRYDSVTSDSVRLAIDERDAGGRAHTGETVGFLAFGESGVLYRAGTSSFTFTTGTVKEFEFTVQHFNAHPNVTYFFRLYDVARDVAIAASSTKGSPSLSTEGASVTSTISGINAGSVIDGITIDATTTATSVPFGILTFGVERNAAQRLTISANATQGYQILAYERQDLTSGNGATISDISGSNLTPVAWNTGCTISAISCYGYHVGDDVLSGGSTRFLLSDTFAAMNSTPSEVAYSSLPATAESTDIVYRIKVSEQQPAGQYESKVVYIVVPVF